MGSGVGVAEGPVGDQLGAPVVGRAVGEDGDDVGLALGLSALHHWAFTVDPGKSPGGSNPDMHSMGVMSNPPDAPSARH